MLITGQDPTTEKTQEAESPARRLGVLYVASLFSIAALSAVAQVFVLNEVSWQRSFHGVVSHSSRQRSLDHSLALTALSVQAADDRAAAGERAQALREAIGWNKKDAGPATASAPRPGPISGTGAKSLAPLSAAELHRAAAVRAAEALLARFEVGGKGLSRAALEPMVRAIVAEERNYDRELGAVILRTEDAGTRHTDRLETVQYTLFGFMMVVLLLEGLCVVSPAVKRIEAFMAEMYRSNEEMRSYAARLEQSNRELQDFASVASHDLQEPLRKVQAFSDRLKSKYAASIDDQGRDYLDRIQNAAKRMQTLINDLLTFCRVTTKAQPFVRVDVAVATRDVVSDLEVRIEQVRGRVELGDLPTVEADPMQVRQLMQNLIGNALKYHRPEAAPVVKVYGRRVSNDRNLALTDRRREICEILVEDNGIGFEEIYTDRIFTIFQRLHGRTEYEGTGIGLAVCRKIAERHGGSITARSTPGKGSTFTVRLPIRQPKEMSPHGHAA